MSDKSDSESSRGNNDKNSDMQNDDDRDRRRNRSESDDRRKESHKLFVTGLDGNARESELERELEKHFCKYGKLDRITVKRSRNNEYSFAFIEYERGVDGSEAVRKLDQVEVGDRKMKVELQDDSRRRKDKNEGCYICHKFGHFARECREKRDDRDRSRDRRRSRSRDYRRRRSSTPRSRSRRKDKDRRKKGKKRDRRSRSRSSKRSDSRRRQRRSRSRSDSYN